MELQYLGQEIETRLRIALQRKEIRQLERAGTSTVAANELLAQMLTKVDELCSERDRRVVEDRLKYPGTDKVINGPGERRFR